MSHKDTTQALLDQWAESPEAFASCFVIADKNAQVVDFDVSQPQRMVLSMLERHKKGALLKGRQMWITTILLVYELRLCLFKPGATVAVAMHSDTNAVLMSDRAEQLYRGNEMLMELMPMVGKNGHRILFANGSQMLFVTANSEVLRSFPVNFAHFSEVRDYDDLGATLASVKVAPDGWLYIESTAGGQDDFHAIWTDPQSGFAKQFLCWRDHPEYRSDVPLPLPLVDEERDYITRHKLTLREAQWWVKERRGLSPQKRILMVQEHPSTDLEAFLLSGDKFLKRQVPVPPTDPVQPDARGIVRLHAYDPTHQYSCGIDPAPGSSDAGDPTAIVIIDLTDRKVVLTQEFREPTRAHEDATRALLAEYGDPVTAVETASEGLGLCDFLRSAGVPMYHMVAYAGLAQEMLPRHGWRTDVTTRPILFGAIYEASIGFKPYVLGCHRLIHQANSLCYDKKGKPAAPKHGHDDLPVAFGCALMAADQAMPARKQSPTRLPVKTALDALEEQLNAGNGSSDFFDDAYDAQPTDFY